ncbi:hypothetical protein SAMN06295926_11395 [Lysinibacillus sp. AC-3]|nr:hypothetical protein SAMN06295926_11395 [Lysinibacillus sp. AC-3]
MFSWQGEAGKHAFLFMLPSFSEALAIEGDEMNADIVSLPCSKYLKRDC